MCVCLCVCVCVHACVHACVRAYVNIVFVCYCMYPPYYWWISLLSPSLVYFLVSSFDITEIVDNLNSKRQAQPSIDQFL